MGHYNGAAHRRPSATAGRLARAIPSAIMLVFVTVIVGTTSLTVHASAKPESSLDSKAYPLESSDLALQVLAVSGLKAQIQQIPLAVRDGFDRSVASGEFDGRLPAEFLPLLRRGFEQAFATEKLEERIVTSFQRSLSAFDLGKILAWHSSELGRKIESAELQHSNAVEAKDRDTFLQLLAEDPLSQARLNALTDLENAWQVSKTSVDMMIDMQVAVTTALLSLMPESRGVPVENIIAYYAASRPQLEEHFASETLFSMSYIYQSLSIEDIQQYTAFAQGELGDRYVRVTNDALHRSMLEGSLELGKTMGDLFNKSAEQKSANQDLIGSGI